MSLVDRFVCRREGHKPSWTIKSTSAVFVKSYLTDCVRCGKVIELDGHGREVKGRVA